MSISISLLCTFIFMLLVIRILILKFMTMLFQQETPIFYQLHFLTSIATFILPTLFYPPKNKSKKVLITKMMQDSLELQFVPPTNSPNFNKLFLTLNLNQIANIQKMRAKLAKKLNYDRELIYLFYRGNFLSKVGKVLND